MLIMQFLAPTTSNPAIETSNIMCVLVSFLDNVDGGVERSVELLEQVVIALDLVLSKIQNSESILKSKKENEGKLRIKNCIG